MRLICLVFYLSSVLAMSGCLGGNENTKTDIPFELGLGWYTVNFALPYDDYEVKTLSEFRTNGSGWGGEHSWPAYTSYQRKIEGEYSRHSLFSVIVAHYDEPQDQTLEALTHALSIGEKGPAEWATYESDSEFQHTYRVMKKGIGQDAACWLDEKTMLEITALNFEQEEFIKTLKSIRTMR